MKRLLVSSLLGILLCNCAAIPTAKDPCSGVQTYKDDFGKTTRGLILYMDNDFRASGLLKEEGKHILRALFTINAVSDVQIPEDTPAKMALIDGTLIDLVSSKVSIPMAGANPYVVFTQWGVDFELNPDQFNKLKSSGVRVIQLNIGSLELLVRLSDRDGNAMRYLAECLAS